MTKKIWWLAVIILFTVGNYVILSILWPAIVDLVGIAEADPVLSGPTAGNFTFYAAAVKSAPYWLYFVPAIIGVIEAITVMRAAEYLKQKWAGGF